MYVAPKIVSYGDATTQILGECGSGFEYLCCTKAGSYRLTQMRCNYDVQMWTCEAHEVCFTTPLVFDSCASDDDCG